jgi:hypothetical protein
MTILPELRDGLARSRPEPILPELRDGLVAARPPRRSRRRRPAMVGLLATGGLLVTAGALAATGVLQIGIGDPVTPKYVNRDPARGVGVPVDTSARLLPLRVADPAGGPPWGLRLVTTSRGLTCLQVGRVVGDQLGLLGQDGVAGDDGRFHPLPPATAATPTTPCGLPDGAGQFFTGVDKPSYASGDSPDRSCSIPGERPKGRKPCPAADARRVGYGLLDPQAVKITFADGSTAVPVAPYGAYLFVTTKGASEQVFAMGGGPSIAGPGSYTVRRIDYRDGTSCPAPGAKQAFCKPKGAVERAATKPSASVRRPVQVTLGHRRVGKLRFPALHVSFRAPVAITDARRMYVLEGRFPDSRVKNCRQVVVFVPNGRNVARDEQIRLVGLIPPQCHGVFDASVLYADISYSHGNQPAARVARIRRQIR